MDLGNRRGPGGKLSNDAIDNEISRYKEQSRKRRAELGGRMINDNTLRSIKDLEDPSSIIKGRAGKNNISGLVDVRMKDVLDRTAVVSDRVLEMSNMSAARLRNLREESHLPVPITDRDLTIFRPYNNPIENEIREEQTRLFQEGEEIARQKMKLLEDLKNKNTTVDPYKLNERQSRLPAVINQRSDGQFTFGAPGMSEEGPQYLNQRNTAKIKPNFSSTVGLNQKQNNILGMGRTAKSISNMGDDRANELMNILNRNKSELEFLRNDNKEFEEKIKKKDEILMRAHQNDQISRRKPRGNPQEVQKKPMFTQALIQNAKRNPDLNDFERNLVFLEAQDLDSLRMMLNVPVGTDLYRFKAEQFKETTTTRGEIEKLVYEQMLKSMKKGLDLQIRGAEARSQDLLWTDEQRRNLLAGYIRKNLGVGLNLEYNGPPIREDSEGSEEVEVDVRLPEKKKIYDSVEGFNVYWDYCLGLPQVQNQTAFDFQIVSQGEILRDVEQSADIGKNIEEGNSTCRSIFALKNRIKGIPINPETLMIWKVYQPVNEGSREPMTPIGWTQIDLFTLIRELKRGRWKCPLYELPVDTNITKEGVQLLKPIPGIWFYLRIAYPWKDEFNNGSLVPEESSFNAEIPEIHLRAANWTQPQNGPPAIEDVPNKPPEAVINPDDKPEKPKTPPPKQEEPYKPPEDPDANKPPDPGPQIGQRVGIKIKINKVISHQAQSHMRVSVTCLEQNIPVKDDTTKRWERSTMIHNPLVRGKNDLDEIGASIVESQLMKQGRMANLAEGSDIIFPNEVHQLLRNLKAMVKKSGKHLYLMFKLLEKPAPKDVLRGKNKGFAESAEANLGGLQFNTIAYAIFQLTTDEFNLREGLNTIYFHKPPLKVPPINEEFTPKTDTLSQLEFDLSLRPYEEKDVIEDYRQRLILNPVTKLGAVENIPDQITDRQKDSKAEIKVDNSPFIKNTRKQYADKIFEKGYGIDFYLDACRFLPDNVSITKCIIRVVNAEYRDIFPIKATIPTKINRDNDCYNPIFDYRFEYRLELIDPQALLFLSFVTIDTTNNQPRIIGYSAINLFMNRFKLTQPTEPNDTDIFLQSGNYQLPINPVEPLRIPPFTMEMMERLDTLPCSSVLIRIRLAPLSDDLKRVLGKADVPKSQWKTVGIWPERPEYSSGEYNSQYCRIREIEKPLFILRNQREKISLAKRALELKAKNGVSDQNFDAKELFYWLDSLLKVNSSTLLLDGKYFAKYMQSAGFSFSVDAIHNVPNSNPYIAFYSISPPPSYYEDEKNVDNVELVAKIDWNHPVGQIKYYDDYKDFRDMPYDQLKHFIIEVKEVVFTKEETFDIKDFGWTVVPVFIGEGYITTGHYQVPLYKGAFPKDKLISEMRETYSWDVIKKFHKEKKIEWTSEYSSVMIRMLDGQQKGQLREKLDIKSLDFMYLPADIDDKTLFAYNQQVKMQLDTQKKIGKTVPDKRNPTKYNNNLIIACVEKYGFKYNVADDN